MSGTSFPPWLAIHSAINNPEVQGIAYISAANVASMVVHAGGGAIETDPTGTVYDEEMTLKRLSLAIKIIGRKIDIITLATGLMQSPAVIAALPQDTNNIVEQIQTVDLVGVWTRNWSDYATLIAIIG